MLKFFNKRYFILFVFPFILGGITVLGFRPFNLFIFNAISVSLLFYLIFYIKKKTQSLYRKKPFLKNLFFLGTSYGFGFFLFGFYWIAYSLTFDDSFKFLIPFSLILIPLFLSLFFSIPIVLVGYFVDLKISSIILISLLLSIFDFLRSFILTGFPWNLWAYSFSWSQESLQILSIIGIFSFNLLLITLFFLPAVLFFRGKFKYFFTIFFIILAFINYFYGSYKINSESKDYVEKKVNFKIVSAGTNLSEFKNPNLVVKKLITFSEPNKDQETIFVWPEGVILDVNFEKLEEIKKLFRENFSKKHMIILGANTNKTDNQSENFYNSLIIVDRDLNIIDQYDKKKLVPFGEFLPFEKILNRIGIKKVTPGYSSFSKGKSNPIISLKFNNKNINLLPLICYEIIFPDLLENKKNKFDFVINISEDAWFGDSIGPQQHFTKAVFRSIESETFTVRSANKGISAFISPNGKILKSLKPNEFGNIELDLPILKSEKNTTKKSLIFSLLIITYVVTFFVLRKLKL